MFTAIECASNALRLQMPSSNNVETMFVQQWLQSVELFDDEYLAAFGPRNRNRLLGAFASAVRAARFSGPAYCQLAAGTVSDSVNHVVASFVETGFPGPDYPRQGTLLDFYSGSTRVTETSTRT
jgi:hypothetical protein